MKLAMSSSPVVYKNQIKF